jgi:hypothetical protein
MLSVLHPYTVCMDIAANHLDERVCTECSTHPTEGSSSEQSGQQDFAAAVSILISRARYVRRATVTTALRFDEMLRAPALPARNEEVNWREFG